MKLRNKILAVSVLLPTLAAFSMTGPTAASTAQHSAPGELGVSSGGTWADKLTFSDPNVSATFSVTNANYQAVLSDNTCMTTDTCLWWGTDDEAGRNCTDSGTYVDSDCDDETSQVNSVLAFTPNSVTTKEGVTWTWRANRCGNVNTAYPTPSNPLVSCPNVSTVTIQFSEPVSNAVVHLANIGGNGNFPISRKTSFTTGFDMTLFSKWKLTSGQSLVLLSGSESSNLMVDGNTVRNRYTPNGLGSRVSTRECGYNEIACSYDNGTGSGSVLVLGTYSTLTFDIDLGWALVNYGPSNPAGLSTMQSWGAGSFNIPEGVSVQLSFYKEGPALPTTTIAPTTTVAAVTTVSPTTTVVPTTTSAPVPKKTSDNSKETEDLPATGNGNSVPLLWLGTSMTVLGLLFWRRRASTHIKK